MITLFFKSNVNMIREDGVGRVGADGLAEVLQRLAVPTQLVQDQAPAMTTLVSIRIIMMVMRAVVVIIVKRLSLATTDHTGHAVRTVPAG
jgi:hypothetical protein